jgi:ABC-type Fe3+/spermidine/putrescine transport system ATPase subunit
MPGPGGLSVEHVSFAVGPKAILRDVSVEARPGETLAVLGPSGCGKTTLLRIIAGLERPDAGRVLFDGDDVTGVPAHRRTFGMMFQDFALFPHLDVRKNVEFGLRRSKLDKPERRARVDELLELVGLSGYGKRTTEALSGGERQRVALARALAPQPRLLMLDEPLGSLDRGLRERLIVELRAILKRLAIPAVYVTHDQFEAFTIADRMAIMRAGQVVRTGTPEDVYAEPRTEFVARFLGFENVVRGTLSEDGAAQTPVGRWRVPLTPGPSRTADGEGGCNGGARPREVALLLRGEGVALTESGGDGVVSGVVVSRLFQGANQRVELDAQGERLAFELPADVGIPREGERISLQVPNVQLIATDAEASRPGSDVNVG